MPDSPLSATDARYAQKELRQRKLAALEASEPQQIVTANIGCQSHLGAGTETPVVHWIELLERSILKPVR